MWMIKYIPSVSCNPLDNHTRKISVELFRIAPRKKISSNGVILNNYSNANYNPNNTNNTNNTKNNNNNYRYYHQNTINNNKKEDDFSSSNDVVRNRSNKSKELYLNEPDESTKDEEKEKEKDEGGEDEGEEISSPSLPDQLQTSLDIKLITLPS